VDANVDRMPDAERPPHLLHFRISHYNEKVRWALDHKRWPHTREACTPGFHIPRVRLLTGQNRLPVLVLDGVAHRESARILEEIEARRPEPPLFPADPAQRRRAAELQSFFDGEVAPALRRLFWSTYLDRPADCTRLATMGSSRLTRAGFRVALPLMRPLFRQNLGLDRARLAMARERLSSYVERLESELGESGYLVGDRFGIADLAVASVMTAILRPPEFPYPLPEPWPPALVELRAGIAGRTGCKWVFDIYRRHRGTSAEIGASTS
jgi:glutathione S-transferase